jgi:hypothetical protein
VPGFKQLDSSTFKLNSKERCALNPLHYSLKYSLNNENYGCLGTNFSPLELLALYCSAAMHDYDHPGRNNQFLIATNSPLVKILNKKINKILV